MKPTLLLALEGGGTRSQAALLTGDGVVLQSGEAGDVNTNFTSREQAQKEVLSAVAQVLAAAQVGGERVDLFVSALVGPRFGKEVFGELCPRARFLFFNERDVVFARAGIYQPHGIGVVAATGATAWGMRADDGRQVFFGGWGSLLGDEGSAYAMGLMGLRAAARAFEGRQKYPTRLVEGVCQHWGLQRETFRQELVQMAYHKPLSRADIAGLAIVITGLAREGDEEAALICQETANDLAQLGLHATRQLFQKEEIFSVVAAGGMTNAGDLVLGPLRQGLKKEFPQARLLMGSEPPAESLGRLAINRLSKEEELC
jgi:N-acetylglucosamine kinase-like BadF-type ATPase